MQVGQEIIISPKKRGTAREEGNESSRGTIIIVERRYIVIQFPNYRRSFLKAEVKHNIGRKFTLLDGDSSGSPKEAGQGI